MQGIAEYLTKKRILVTGATGFLGQPLIEKILFAAPTVERVYALIRPSQRREVQARRGPRRSNLLHCQRSCSGAISAWPPMVAAMIEALGGSGMGEVVLMMAVRPLGYSHGPDA